MGYTPSISICKKCIKFARPEASMNSLQAVVDKEVSQLLSKQEAEEQLASLQQRKEALQAERDDKQQQRSQLELQLMRFAQRPHSSAVAESQTAERHQIPAEGQSHHGQGGSANSPEKALAARGLQDIAQDSTWPVSPEQLTQEEEEVLRQAAALDDGVDTCQAQLQYLESSLVHCKAVSHSVSGSSTDVPYHVSGLMCGCAQQACRVLKRLCLDLQCLSQMSMQSPEHECCLPAQLMTPTAMDGII